MGKRGLTSANVVDEIQPSDRGVVVDDDSADIVSRARGVEPEPEFKVSVDQAKEVLSREASPHVFYAVAPMPVGNLWLRKSDAVPVTEHGQTRYIDIQGIPIHLRDYKKAPDGQKYCRIDLSRHPALKRPRSKQFADGPTTVEKLVEYMQANKYFLADKIITEEEYFINLEVAVETAEYKAQIEEKAAKAKADKRSKLGIRK